ncbi:hypothetical protein H1C71_001684, partial [Ictidomys tridecemlineatus]
MLGTGSTGHPLSWGVCDCWVPQFPCVQGNVKGTTVRIRIPQYRAAPLSVSCELGRTDRMATGSLMSNMGHSFSRESRLRPGPWDPGVQCWVSVVPACGARAAHFPCKRFFCTYIKKK